MRGFQGQWWEMKQDFIQMLLARNSPQEERWPSVFWIFSQIHRKVFREVEIIFAVRGMTSEHAQNRYSVRWLLCMFAAVWGWPVAAGPVSCCVQAAQRLHAEVCPQAAAGHFHLRLWQQLAAESFHCLSAACVCESRPVEMKAVTAVLRSDFN